MFWARIPENYDSLYFRIDLIFIYYASHKRKEKNSILQKINGLNERAKADRYSLPDDYTFVTHSNKFTVNFCLILVFGI